MNQEEDETSTKVIAKRGPRTSSGKEAVALNAVRHGIVSPVVPLPSEDVSAWDELRQGVFDTYAPVGTVEVELCRRVAELFWRLRRVAPYEASIAAAARERVPIDFKAVHGKHHPESVEYAEARVAGMQEAIREIATRSPSSELTDSASLAFTRALREAGAADGTVMAGRRDGWTPERVREAIYILAEDRSKPVEDVWDDVVRRLEDRLRTCQRDLEFVQDEQDRMRRERLLPAEQSLLNLSKYEAHLNRQLYQALHEIEALQGRRSGKPMPLARVQVTG